MIDPRDTAVMMIVFNRPDLTRQLFERIREVQPRRLYVGADGARPNRKDDIESTRETRAIVEKVDWDCEVRTLFHDENLGVKNGIKTALDWFFDEEEEGIILEDDCIPEPTFFRYAAELLDRYRDDDRISTITGTNLLLGTQQFGDSYYFSRYLFVWGWAGWRRVWRQIDLQIKTWPRFRDEGRLRRVFPLKRSLKYWTRVFDRTYSGGFNSWAYPFYYSQLVQNRMSIVPAQNLISNLGWGEGSTHTTNKNPEMGTATLPMEFPLRHPEFIVPDERADQFVEDLVFAKPLHRKVRNRLGRLGARVTGG